LEPKTLPDIVELAEFPRTFPATEFQRRRDETLRETVAGRKGNLHNNDKLPFRLDPHLLLVVVASTGSRVEDALGGDAVLFAESPDAVVIAAAVAVIRPAAGGRKAKSVHYIN
jgi:hypothetical protein